MTHLDLFSGIGGIALAARWAGFSTRLFCEIDPYCRRVLAKHWPGVPCHDDVRTLDRAALDRHQIGPVALLTGGFPCQPFSSAGKRKGQSDDRFLWPAMLDVVRLTRPAWVVGENVAGFVRLGLDRAIAELEGEGYAVRPFVLPACAVGVPHQRQRCFVVGHSDSDQQGTLGAVRPANSAQSSRIRQDVPDAPGARCAKSVREQQLPDAPASGSSQRTAADTLRQRPAAKRRVRSQPGCERTSDRPADVRCLVAGAHGIERRPSAVRRQTGHPAQRRQASRWQAWPAEPPVGRVVDGLSPGLDRRLRGLGNAVVPAQIFPILSAIADLIS